MAIFKENGIFHNPYNQTHCIIITHILTAKGLIVDTEIYLLLTTFIVSAFHLLFDCLAFKNDVSYWRKRETMAGLSIRTVAFQMISTYIISIHLFHEDTSILVSGPMLIR